MDVRSFQEWIFIWTYFLERGLPRCEVCVWTWICISVYLPPGHQDKLGVAETKLLHTLHWMLLEAPQECPPGYGQGFSSSHAFLANQSAAFPSASTEEDENVRFKLFQRSMATVELFIFLFAPLINRVKVRTYESHFKPYIWNQMGWV